MPKTFAQIQAEVDSTLRGIIYVQPLTPGVIMATEAFWDRCELLTPNWREEKPECIYVRGYAGACKWNAWKVFTDALEPSLRIYQGYAFGGGSWAEHCWCMLSDRFVETTGLFDIYYGAELNAQERATLAAGVAAYNPLEHNDNLYWDSRGPFRVPMFCNENTAATICREWDQEAESVKDGLGH